MDGENMLFVAKNVQITISHRALNDKMHVQSQANLKLFACPR